MLSFSIQQALYHASKQLSPVTDTPALEAEILLAFTLAKPRTYLLAHPEQPLTEHESNQFTSYLTRRCQQEPLPYITGKKEFWSLELSVNPHTLIPRPETELLVETILTALPQSNETTIKLADLGTGSGAIALAIAHERPTWQIFAIDISDQALQTARNNARELGINNVSFCQGNWCTALPCTDFDVIVSNPPYIAEHEWPLYARGLAFEPRAALVSGVDGLDAIREISRIAKNYLKSGGYILVEHGFTQGEAVREIFAAAGYTGVHSLCDLSGQERVTIGVKKA